MDGIIPCNEHGNLEIWDGNEGLLPIGTSLITIPGAAKLAQSFGIQYRNAVFGFENKNGRSYPNIGGIIVLSENAELLTEALEHIQIERDLKRNEEHEKLINSRWEKMVRCLIIREGLRIRYGA